MTSVKTFHIRGEYRRRKKKIPFGKYVRAVNEKDALEYIYNTLGSKHKVKRNMIDIDPKNIREITDPEEIKDTVVKTFAVEDDLIIPKRK
jgi:large subunit ribosomal protein LX